MRGTRGRGKGAAELLMEMRCVRWRCSLAVVLPGSSAPCPRPLSLPPSPSPHTYLLKADPAGGPLLGLQKHQGRTRWGWLSVGPFLSQCVSPCVYGMHPRQ